MPKLHTFHIPVMGTGFSIDTPLKVARYGISSVISLVDDVLIEKMRKFYCQKMGEHYIPITKHDHDHRARRITAYLDLVDRIVQKQFKELKNSAFEVGSEITKYFELLPETSPVKILYDKMLKTTNPQKKLQIQTELREQIVPGDINVNIMTKLDRTNYAQDGTELPSEFSDALAALRGYAQSTLQSAIVFSAGFNRRLYSYVENFKDFYADATGFIKKRIIIKVSDYRSAFTQGKFFAKKGIWVSEYRIESGLNCGGHAFASDGLLMGPILEEFKIKKQELIDSLHNLYNEALKLKDRLNFAKPHEVLITAQGGIGTFNEDRFLRDHYKIDGTGWGTPFLLCPEATNVDLVTLHQLAKAKEEDLYLSDISPLGVPFHTLRRSQSNMERDRRIEKGRPGSACPKGYLVSNTEFTPKPICTASRQYQKLKLELLEKTILDPVEYKNQYNYVTGKSCICHDLGETAIINNHLEDNQPHFTAICPGPNIAYFSKICSLMEMVGHIYGRINILNAPHRPNMFIKELDLYIDYLKKEVTQGLANCSEKQAQYFTEFKNNLLDGIEYYKKLIPQMLSESKEYRERMFQELASFKEALEEFVVEYQTSFSPTPAAVAV